MSSRNSSEEGFRRGAEDKETSSDNVPSIQEGGSSEDAEKAEPPQDLKDGGFDAWLNVLGTHLVYISTW